MLLTPGKRHASGVCPAVTQSLRVLDKCRSCWHRFIEVPISDRYFLVVPPLIILYVLTKSRSFPLPEFEFKLVNIWAKSIEIFGHNIKIFKVLLFEN